MNYIVVTSINGVTEAIEKFSSIRDWKVIVIGDKKSLPYNYTNVEFLSIEDQLDLGFKSLDTTPFNHYSRKNLGYLYAMSKGADHIYDTDDDTIPYANWDLKNFACNIEISGDKYINPFSLFTNENVWPRGFDLSYINKERKYDIKKQDSKIGVWQGVINGDSDFDAIYRLTINKHIIFDKNPDIAIAERSYAPFNTQSTLWNKDLYMLMYIPNTVDFRFTDILRGYISQKIMWQYGYRLGFHAPNTFQVRNAHNYFTDFLGEISMYKNTPKVIDALNSTDLSGKSIGESLILIYDVLCSNNVVENKELVNLSNWIEDINNLTH
jgi:hypothetical protein